MRDSNFTFPAQNRVCVSITQQLYDRKALDTSANLPLLNSLTNLTYLTTTSPRIRELLTLDGGLERLLEILQSSALPRPPSDPVGDWWGLRGPSTASIFAQNQIASLRHSLSFQCVVNLGVRGSEQIRIRLVQSGTLDVIAQILEVWLKGRGMSIISGPLGSQAAVDRSNALAASAAAQVRGVTGGVADHYALGGSNGRSRSGTSFGKERERESHSDKDRDRTRRDKSKDAEKGDKMEDTKRWTRDQRARSDVNGGVSSLFGRVTPNAATPALTPASMTEAIMSNPPPPPRVAATYRSRSDLPLPAPPSSSAVASLRTAEAGPSRFRVSRDGTIKPSHSSPEIMAQVREGVLNADTLSHYVIPEDICTDMDIETDHERHTVTVMHALSRIAGIAKNQLWRYANETSDNAEMVKQYFGRFGLDIRALTHIHLEAIYRRNERELPRLAVMPPTYAPSDIEFWQVFDPAEYAPATEEAALMAEQAAAMAERSRRRHDAREMSIDQDDRAMRQPTPMYVDGGGGPSDRRRANGSSSSERRLQMGVTPGGQTRMLMPDSLPRRTMAIDVPTPRAPSAPLPADASNLRQTFHAARPDNTRGSSAAASLPQTVGQLLTERERESPAPGSVSSTTSIGDAEDMDELRHQLRRVRPMVRLNSGLTNRTRVPPGETAASSNASTPVGTPPAESSTTRRDRSGTVTHLDTHGPVLHATRSGTLRVDAEAEAGDRPISRAGTEDEESTDAEAVPNMVVVEEDIGVVGTMEDEASSTLGPLPGQNVTEQAQAEVDLAMGAPPGAPGAIQTPRITEVTPRQTARPPALPNARIGRTPTEAGVGFEGPGVVIAAGAPRGFSDLSDLVHVMESVTTNGEITYSDDTILLCLQLLAYLSKYPHVRPAFHHLRLPMHPDLDIPEGTILPERPPLSSTSNLFSLVERFTFRPSPPDPDMQRLPSDIQYWAGVIMRNVYKKVDSCGGIRQCANLSCGRWEKFPKEFAKCRRCRRAKYCSKECQSKAWQEGHRFWCYAREPEPGDAAVSGTVIIPSQGRTHRHQRAAEAARQEDPFQGRRWEGAAAPDEDVRMRNTTPAAMDIDATRERIRLHPATITWAERRAHTTGEAAERVSGHADVGSAEDDQMHQDPIDTQQHVVHDVDAMEIDARSDMLDGDAVVTVPGAPVVSHAQPQAAVQAWRQRI